MNSSYLLQQLFDAGQIRLRRSSLFDTAPPPLPPDLSWDRIEGMLLGLAIGDALGRTSEGLFPTCARRCTGGTGCWSGGCRAAGAHGRI